MEKRVLATKTCRDIPNVAPQAPKRHTPSNRYTLRKVALHWVGTHVFPDHLGNENRASGCSPTLEIVVRFDNILEWVALINLH